MHNRKYEKPSPDFIDKIIKKSYEIVQKQPLLSSLQSLFKEFYLPSPQYALSLVFILGIAISFIMPEAAVADDFIDDIYINGGF